MLLSVFPVSATIFSEDGSDRTISELHELMNNTILTDNYGSVMFFYDPDCGSCAPAREFLETYIADHPDTKIEMINVSNGTEEMKQFTKSLAAFHREKILVPALFIGPVGIQGSQTIIANFEDLYRWYHR
jgi:hypothetical protein